MMTSILFICHGNICRSPMAEFVMKDLVGKAGLEAQFHVESAATSTEEIGNPVYPPVRRKLAEHGIDCGGKTARQLTRADCDRFDLLIGMDRANLRNMRHICGNDFAGKLRLLMDYTDCPGDIADPWSTGEKMAGLSPGTAGRSKPLPRLSIAGGRASPPSCWAATICSRTLASPPQPAGNGWSGS